MSADHECGSWNEHFPGNRKWSNAFQIVKGMAPWAAVAMEEIDRVGQRMAARAGESDLDLVWREEWTIAADRVAAVADKAAAEGRQITAGHNYMRAGNYYYCAERMIPPGKERQAYYAKALRCYQAALDRLHKNVERVDVPYMGSAMAAYFMKAPGVSERAPTVVIVNGMDNCKEMSVIFAGLDFAKRGFHTLALDGPGQGETLRLRGIAGRFDYEHAGTAAYDYLAARADVDAKKLSIMGYSFGGYYAARIAAFEKRYAAGISLSAANWDMHAWQVRAKQHHASGGKPGAANTFQWRWVMGAKDEADELAIAKQFSLAGVAGQITCPYLVTHGQNDRIIKLEEAPKLFEAIGSRNKTFKIFSAEEGAAEHAHVDNRQMGIDFAADWLAGALGLAPR
jgi:alpha-beta hydrolase superfamily lysophospholipase